MWYHIIFQKDFGRVNFEFCGEIEWIVYSTQNKGFALLKCQTLNDEAMLNLTVERFIMYESEKQKPNKKSPRITVN